MHARNAGFGQKKEKKGFFDWYFNSRKAKDPPPMARTTPMRIEPKTFFANERTFLSWLHMAVTIGSIAAALLGFAGVSNSHKKPGLQVDFPHPWPQSCCSTLLKLLNAGDGSSGSHQGVVLRMLLAEASLHSACCAPHHIMPPLCVHQKSGACV